MFIAASNNPVGCDYALRIARFSWKSIEENFGRLRPKG